MQAHHTALDRRGQSQGSRWRWSDSAEKRAEQEKLLHTIQKGTGRLQGKCQCSKTRQRHSRYHGGRRTWWCLGQEPSMSPHYRVDCSENDASARQNTRVLQFGVSAGEVRMYHTLSSLGQRCENDENGQAKHSQGWLTTGLRQAAALAAEWCREGRSKMES
ncbi:hypothetical protein BCR44DRAFT_38394 [Catenaria anguillulae PL171]|uniref:Uncharacterized protein n=1 Tax=Catenaria anguillulae PL171 TaxID=765915 RepID=A0A1Y2HPC6_9FUNG|nr:hypothetical protein BCR44DRAFT_38394 [Catenaria anguillulae PL171]